MKILMTLDVRVDLKDGLRIFEEIPRKVREGKNVALRDLASLVLKNSGLRNPQVQPFVVG